MKEVKKSLATGLVSGFLSSLCCVTPLVLVLVGVSGVSGAMGLAGTLQKNFRWTLFIPLGVLFLSVAVYFHIRRTEGVCNFKSIRKYKWFVLGTSIFAIIVWLVLIYVIVPLAFRYIS